MSKSFIVIAPGSQCGLILGNLEVYNRLRNLLWFDVRYVVFELNLMFKAKLIIRSVSSKISNAKIGSNPSCKCLWQWDFESPASKIFWASKETFSKPPPV